MSSRRSYEVVYDRFHKRWVLKPQGLPGAIQVAKTKDEIIERADSVCSHHVCTLRIHREDGQVEEERTYGGKPR